MHERHFNRLRLFLLATVLAALVASAIAPFD